MNENFFVFAAFAVITGSLTCAAILPFEKIIYKFTSASFMKFLMGFCLMSFVIPSYMIFFLKEGKENSIIIGDRVPVIMVENDIIEKIYIYLDGINIGRFASYIWLFGTVIYFVFTVVTYIRFILNVRIHSMPVSRKFKDTYDSIDIPKKRMELLVSNAFIQPFTSGIRKKYIVIPAIFEETMTDDEIRLILMHEITHAGKNDVFLKVFMEVMNSLNWFNPLFYMLKMRLVLWTEMSCDEKLNRTFTGETRIRYVELLLKVFEMNVKAKSMPASFLTSKKSLNMKRRFEKIMKNKSKGSKFANIAVSFMALCVFCGAGYVAKEADYKVYGVFGDEKDIMNENGIYLYENTEKDKELESNINETDTKHSHKFVKVTIDEHRKNSDGSCKMTTYSAEECTICGIITDKELIDVYYYDVCPH